MARKEYSNPDIKVLALPKDEDVMTDSLTNIEADLLTGDDYGLIVPKAYKFTL